MNKDLTIVFSSYQSHRHLEKLIKQFSKNFKIIIIENSLDYKIKLFLEKKSKNVKVIIPKENLGLAKSYNLGLKNAKTKYVFLNNPDLQIDIKSINNLIKCAKNLKNFGILSPVYKKEKVFKNYEIFSNQIKIAKKNNKFQLLEVDRIDNNFLVKKNEIKTNSFDENYFLYFETIDFAQSLKKRGKKLYISKKIKFHHYGSGSLPKKYQNLVKKTRAFHFNWSKFYFFKKNYNYFFALKKVFPNLIKALKKLFVGFLTFDFEKIKIGSIELMGLITAIFFIKSFYRPKN